MVDPTNFGISEPRPEVIGQTVFDGPIFVISIAAELAGMHPQTLRQYDRLGLVQPGRSRGGGRRYSPRDVVMLREIGRLSHEDGVNLAGIKRIMELERHVQRLQEEAARLALELDQVRAERNSTALVVWRPQSLRYPQTR